MTKKRDGRRVCNLKPPTATNLNQISLTMDAECYRQYYELCMIRGLSGADMVRTLVKEEFQRQMEVDCNG